MTDAMMSRWAAAQIGERRFHCDEVEGFPSLEVRRAREAEMRRWYAGMLRITPRTEEDDEVLSHVHGTVTDIGAGPQSLLLTSSVSLGSVVVDPLTFSEDDEGWYRQWTFGRATVAAEDYVGPQTDEVWLYNCLQHVRDPERVLAVAMAHARKVVRIFEWIGVPTDAMHLHTLDALKLRGALWRGDWTERYTVSGNAEHVPYWAQDFYAGVWERPAT